MSAVSKIDCLSPTGRSWRLPRTGAAEHAARNARPAQRHAPRPSTSTARSRCCASLHKLERARRSDALASGADAGSPRTSKFPRRRSRDFVLVARTRTPLDVLFVARPLRLRLCRHDAQELISRTLRVAQLHLVRGTPKSADFFAQQAQNLAEDVGAQQDVILALSLRLTVAIGWSREEEANRLLEDLSRQSRLVRAEDPQPFFSAGCETYGLRTHRQRAMRSARPWLRKHNGIRAGAIPRPPSHCSTKPKMRSIA